MSVDGTEESGLGRGVVRTCGYGLNTGSEAMLDSSAPTPTRAGVPHGAMGLATPGSQEQDRTRMRFDNPTGPPLANQYPTFAGALETSGNANFGGGNFGPYGMPPWAAQYNQGYNAGYGVPMQQAPMRMPPQPPFMTGGAVPAAVQQCNSGYSANAANEQVRASRLETMAEA